jgi:tetratricopeptide (TPR) repeat protein
MIYSDWKLENDLGSDYARMGDMENAHIHFTRSYDYYPTPWNLYHLGMYYQDLGDTKNAHVYYSRAYNAMRNNEFSPLIKPGKSTLEYNVYARLANILFLEEKYAQSLKYSKLGLKYYPNASDLWVTYAASEYFVGNQSAAVAAAAKAKELSPNSKTEYLYNQIKNKKPLTIQ